MKRKFNESLVAEHCQSGSADLAKMGNSDSNHDEMIIGEFSSDEEGDVNVILALMLEKYVRNDDIIANLQYLLREEEGQGKVQVFKILAFTAAVFEPNLDFLKDLFKVSQCFGVEASSFIRKSLGDDGNTLAHEVAALRGNVERKKLFKIIDYLYAINSNIYNIKNKAGQSYINIMANNFNMVEEQASYCEINTPINNDYIDGIDENSSKKENSNVGQVKTNDSQHEEPGTQLDSVQVKGEKSLPSYSA